jgi:glycosyltransferase involved in cell wall biosynthesis
MPAGAPQMKNLSKLGNFNGLERIDEHRTIDNEAEICLFMKVRNEARRLPYFLNYYRRLGIARFFIVDNGSNDHTVEFLKGNSDCHVFFTDQNMAKSRAGMNWIEPLLKTYGQNRWCVIVDADELLIYPNSEKVILTEFCQKLERRNENALPCIMIDMYSEGNIEDSEYHEGQSFIDACPFFDRSGYRYIRSRHSDVPIIIGGPRLRTFFPELLDRRISARARRWILNNIANVIARVPYVGQLPTMQQLRPLVAPFLNKVPLIRWSEQMSLAPAAHSISGARPAAGNGALLHFKFLGDFGRRVGEEIVRKAYVGDEYKRYCKRVGQGAPLNFMCELSTRFGNSQQLLELGLLKDLG